MAEVLCNQCGHRNPLGANFCSSCGAPLEHEGGERTTVSFSIDVPAETGEDEITFDLGDIPAGAGLLVVTGGRSPARGSP